MEPKNPLEPFMFVRTDPYIWINGAPSLRHSKVMGFLFPDVPEEMIHAFGILPVSISGSVGSVKHAHAYLPSFACAPNVGPLESALTGDLSGIDGLIIPYACDSMRAFSQVWEETFPHLFNHTFWLPKKTGGTEPRAFFKQELLRMKDALTRFTGKRISNQDILKSIRVYNRNRRMLRTLNSYRSEKPSFLSNADFMTIVKASTCMPKEEHSDRLVELLDSLKKATGNKKAPDHEFMRIFLFGTVCENYKIFQCIDRTKMAVVEDNLYNGLRYFSDDVEEEGDPIDNLVARHFRRDPMSCYHCSKEDWRRYIGEKIIQNHIDGVVYLIPKHCEVLQFDYPMIKAVLDENDIPLILIETDEVSDSIAQIEMRIEAFSEILRGRKSEII